MFTNILRGAAAGAAGATALNAITYCDMALRARPASTMPQRAVDELAARSGHPVPGEGEERDNRLDGLGPLAGLATGVGIGVAAGLLRPLITKLPLPIGAVLLGAAAMLGSNAPMAKLGLTDPSSWSSEDWLSDAAPHLGYGLATAWTLRAESR